MVAVAGYVRSGLAMVHLVGMGEAIECVAAMAESEHRSPREVFNDLAWASIADSQSKS